MNLFGQMFDIGAFAGLNSPKLPEIERGIPEGMNPGVRTMGAVAPGSSYMDQANQLSGVHLSPMPQQPAPAGQQSPAQSPAPQAPTPSPITAAPPYLPDFDLFGLGGMGGGYGLPFNIAPAAPKPAPKVKSKPPKPLPPEFMYGHPFMGLNGYMF